MSTQLAKSWFAVDVEADADAVEAVEYALNSLDSLGNEVDQMRKSEDGLWTVTGYFNELPEPERLSDEIETALRIHGLTPASIAATSTREVVNRDWLAEWKKHWRPTVLGDFVIAPPWEQVDEPTRIVIRIEPNMAFGTGTHETTKLCLTAINDDYRPGESFLDVGTGTGILVIAAAKLNLRSEISDLKLLAVDTDIDAVVIARENAELNCVAGNIAVRQATIDDITGSFDLVCANLTLDVILPILPQLLVKTGRKLVLSGILAEQETLIVDKLSELQIRSFEIDRDGEWIAVRVSV